MSTHKELHSKVAGALLNKMLTIGAGAAIATPAAAIIGHKFGYQSGARKMGNEMATQFNIANQEENSQIANEFFNRGVIAASEIPKEAMECYYEGFNDELEKIGAGVPKWMKEMMPSLKKALTTGYKAIKGAPGQAIKGTKESFKAAYGKGQGSIRNALNVKKDIKSGLKIIEPKNIPSDDAVRRQYNRMVQKGNVVDEKYMGNAIRKAAPAVGLTLAGGGAAAYGGVKGVQALTDHKKTAELNQTNNPQVPTGTGAERRY
jgi:hypothetical protein